MRTRNEALHKRRKLEIVTMAARCFAAKGIHQTSMQEISEAANISVGALYRYYKSKDAIIMALAEREKEANTELIAHLIGSHDIVEGICQAIPAILNIICSEQYSRLALEIGAEAVRNPKIAEAFGKNENELRLAFIESLKQGQQRGTVDQNLDVEGAAFMILTMLEGVITQATYKNSLSQQQITQSMQHFIRRALRSE